MGIVRTESARMAVKQGARPFDLKGYLASGRELVDSFLRDYFEGADIAPALLKEAMLYSLFAGGKRLRPVLAIAASEAAGKDGSRIVRYAAALELIHTYSLIHDDLPAMDDDDLRRGKPTNHKVFGEAMAILAGDGLLTEAFRMLSVPQRGIKKELLLRAVEDIASKAGLWGMVAGQAQDILSEADGTGGQKRREAVRFIHLHKTAKLITASVRLGGILAGADEKKLAALTEYGHSAGVAFQIADDILDVKGDTALMGKKAGSDERKGKLTYPACFGLEASVREARGLVKKALAAISGFGQAAEPLRAIARYIIKRRS